MESVFGLASSGVYPAMIITNHAVRSYRTFSPLLFYNSGIFSVALSVNSRCPDVIWRCVLWSPDFPLYRKPYSDCLADSSGII